MGRLHPKIPAIFQRRGPKNANRSDPRPSPNKKMRCQDKRLEIPNFPLKKQSNNRRRLIDIPRQARPLIPMRGLANRLRHPIQHERKRGHLKPCHPAPRRPPRQQTSLTQRLGQLRPIIERYLPFSNACSGMFGRPSFVGACDWEALGGCEREGGGVWGGWEGWKDAFAGCDAGYCWAGVFGVFGYAQAVGLASFAGSGKGLLSGPRRHCCGHRAQRPSRLRRLDLRLAIKINRADLPSSQKQIPRTGDLGQPLPTLRRAKRPSKQPTNPLQQHTDAGNGPPLRPRLTPPTPKLTRLLNNAGQGQPHPMRIPLNDRLPGHRQPHGSDPGLRPRPFPAQHVPATHHCQCAGEY